MKSNINILKWLFAFVLIFGGLTIYRVFGVLANGLGDKEYLWLLKIMSEFGLFTSVVFSVGFFHHWIIATEERKETEKELDFSRFMHSLYLGDYVYWLITFDTRYKHHCREIELAIKKDIHIRMLILKECAMPYLDWQSELKQNSGYLFESDKWKIPDIF